MANGERMETVTDFISLGSKIIADGDCTHDIKRCCLLRTEAMRNLDTIFPCSSVGEESACNAGDPGSIPGSGRSPGEGNGNPCQYSCLEKPMDRGNCRLQSIGLQELDMTERRSTHSKQHIKQQRHDFATKGLYIQSYGTHVWL